MTLAAPLFLAAAALAAAIVVGLHLIVRRRPPSALLPTARFIPDVPASATTVDARPSDVPLLLLRVLALLLAGLALAEPRPTPTRASVARVVAVDLSRGADRAAVLAAARPHLAGADAVVVFDSAARVVSADSVNAALARPAVAARGSLSAALVASLRAASLLRDGADSVSLTLVTPALAEEADAATSAVRALWPGRIELERVSPAQPAAARDTVRLTWADSAPSPDWRARERADAPGAVRAGDAVLVAPLARRWRPTGAAGGRVVARWVDGEPAAIERPAAGGCVRSVGFALPEASGTGSERLLAALGSGPCGDAFDARPLSDAALAMVRGSGPLARASDFPAAGRTPSRLAPWLLALALLLLAGEPLVRRARRAHAPAPAADAVERAA